MTNKLRTKDGKLSAYAFACGYMETRYSKDKQRTTEIARSSFYTVKCYTLSPRRLTGIFNVRTLAEVRRLAANFLKGVYNELS